MNGERPVVMAVHKNLEEELKLRREIMERETGRKTRGGLTTFSEIAALELKCMRMSGVELLKNISGLKEIKAEVINFKGIDSEFVPYELFKKLYIFASALNKKKDQNQIKVEVAKIKGLKKNEINCYW